MVQNLPSSAGDTRDGGSTPELGRSPAVGNGNPLQYSCLGNAMDKGAWQATVHGPQRVGQDRATEHTQGMPTSMPMLWYQFLWNVL